MLSPTMDLGERIFRHFTFAKLPRADFCKKTTAPSPTRPRIARAGCWVAVVWKECEKRADYNFAKAMHRTLWAISQSSRFVSWISTAICPILSQQTCYQASRERKPMAKKKTVVNKSAVIRNYQAKNPGASAKRSFRYLRCRE